MRIEVLLATDRGVSSVVWPEECLAASTAGPEYEQPSIVVEGQRGVVTCDLSGPLEVGLDRSSLKWRPSGYVGGQLAPSSVGWWRPLG